MTREGHIEKTEKRIEWMFNKIGLRLSEYKVNLMIFTAALS